VRLADEIRVQSRWHVCKLDWVVAVDLQHQERNHAMQVTSSEIMRTMSSWQANSSVVSESARRENQHAAVPPGRMRPGLQTS
jgi:hypothetical protein